MNNHARLSASAFACKMFVVGVAESSADSTSYSQRVSNGCSDHSKLLRRLLHAMLCCALRIATPMQARDAMLAGRARRAEQRHLGLPAESVLPQAQDSAVLDDVQVLPFTSNICPVMPHVLH